MPASLPKGKRPSAREAVQGLAEASEAMLKAVPCRYYYGQAQNTCERNHPGSERNWCQACKLRRALATYRNREGLREDGVLVSAVYEPLFRTLGMGVADGGAVVFQQLDAIDAALFGRASTADTKEPT